jgi:hypothetical protein
MFRIYSDKDIFENIISSPNNYPNWNKIIKDHSVVCLDINQTDLDVERATPDSFLFLFLQANARDIEIVPLDNYFQTIYANLETVIENPSAAYFLNLPEAEAKKLQDETGIIINCTVIDDKLISNGTYHEWVADEIIPNNWKHILSPFDNFPSNSMIINDRNLFTGIERNVNMGIDNILRYLDSILPKNIKTDYHILIQSEQNSNPTNKQKCDEIATILNNEIRRLRSFNFIIENVFYNRGTMFFASTHNRKIISNYKIGKAEYSFAAFKIRDRDSSKNDDSFNMTTFFDKLESYESCSANLKAHENATLKYKEIAGNCIHKINQSGPNDNIYRYYLNGIEVTQGHSTAVNNRLLN